MKTIEYGEVLANDKLQHQIYQLTLASEEIARVAEAGQFLMIYLDNGINLLPRPFTIHEVGSESISVVYQVTGEGTQQLSHLEAGDEVRLLGPLGTGYTAQKAASVLLLGSGVGVSGLYLLAQDLLEAGVGQLTIGMTFRKRLLLVDAFKALPNTQVIVTTEVGNEAENASLFDQIPLKKGKYERIYICGDEAFMAEAKAWAVPLDVPIEMSHEGQMGCGMGACGQCINSAGIRICQEGPVLKEAK